MRCGILESKKMSKKTEMCWDAKVAQAMKSIGATEDPEAKGLLQVAADVCDSLVVSNVIYSRYEEAAGGTISFTDIFNQVIIGVREQNQNRRLARDKATDSSYVYEMSGYTGDH
jgi:hypothetical protein